MAKTLPPKPEPITLEVPVEFKYTGNATKGGVIDADVFGKSLQGFSQMAHQANRLLYESRSDIRVVVKSDFKEGSFEFAVQVIQVLLEHADSYISTPEGVASVIEYLGWGAVGVTGTFAASFAKEFGGTLGKEVATSLVELLRKTKGEKLKIINAEEEYVVVNHNGADIYVPRKVFNLYKDRQVRESLETFVKPVSMKGYDTIEVKTRQDEKQVVDKKEYFYFEASGKSEFVGTEPFHGKYVVLNANVGVDTNRWRVKSESTKREFEVIISDEAFLNDVKSEKVKFGSGDRLQLKGHIQYDQSARGLESKHFATYAKKIRRLPKKKTAKKPLQYKMVLEPT